MDEPVKKRKTKAPSILETELTMEMKPADARKYFERGFELLVKEAETASDPHNRLDAIRGIFTFYSLLATKDSFDESVTKAARTNDKTLDEVKRLRRKPWEDDTSDNGED